MDTNYRLLIMKKLIITSILIMMLGLSNAQVSFFISPDLYTKMSFNSEDPSLFDSWSTKSPVIPNDLFTYENTNYSLYNPFKLGLSIGTKFKNKNELILGIHSDGVSSKSKVMFFSYQPFLDAYTTGINIRKTTTVQTRVFIAYKYYIKKSSNKTSFALLPSIGLAYRSGKSFQNVGSFGSEGILTKSGIVFTRKSTSYTNALDKAFLLGIGISSDIFLKSKYFCSLTFQYSHTKKSLYFQETRMKVTNTITNESDLYIFTVMNRASGLYLTLSRKIQVYPKKKKTHNKT